MISRSFESAEETEAQDRIEAAEKQLRAAILRSKQWRAITEKLLLSRESLFASRPETTEQLWFTWGQLSAIHDLLHRGPDYVVYSQRAKLEREQAARATVPQASERDDGGPFDLGE